MSEEIKKDYMAQISWSKSYCSGAIPMYGSEIATNTPITIRISEGSMSREHGTTFYHGNAVPIIEVSLTPVQWAEFLTCGNTEGIPCTLTSLHGKHMSRVEPINLSNQFSEDLHKTLSITEKDTDSIIEMVQAAIDSNKPMSKKKMQDLLDQLKWNKQKHASNLKFIKEVFDEDVAVTVAKAKAEIAGYAETMLGGTNIKCVLNLVAMDEKNDEIIYAERKAHGFSRGSMST